VSKFLLELDTDNEAFAEDWAIEVRRILKALVVGEHGPRYDRDAGTVRDVNGNTVGAWSHTTTTQEG
jgi:hypothetical protein